MAAIARSELVLQRLGKDLHAGFGDIISGIARGRGDPLFRARVDDEAGRALVDDIGRENPCAIDDAHEIHGDDVIQFACAPKIWLPGWMPALFMSTSIWP